jgi:L-rhamnose isomerase
VSPQPRWTVPVNFRVQDKKILDDALNIAKSENKDITTIFRLALEEFVKTKTRSADGLKLDKFLDNSKVGTQVFDRILKPVELMKWSDSSLLAISKLLRSRRQELDFELRRRGFYFDW